MNCVGTNKIPIRVCYEIYGTDEYYKKHGDSYINYHISEVQYLINKNIDKIIDNNMNSILDLCSGNGEITDLFVQKGIDNIVGCDPYMEQIYMKNTGKHCYNCSFLDIINGKLTGKFDIVICSFGMHLCNDNMIYNLICMLKYEYNVNKLVIITPNKKPIINKNMIYEEKYKKVRIRIYDL